MLHTRQTADRELPPRAQVRALVLGLCLCSAPHLASHLRPTCSVFSSAISRPLSSATLGMCTYDWKCEDSCCTASSRCAASAYSCRSTDSCSWSAVGQVTRNSCSLEQGKVLRLGPDKIPAKLELAPGQQSASSERRAGQAKAPAAAAPTALMSIERRRSAVMVAVRCFFA